MPDVRKAREVLGFEATTTLDAMLDEVIPWGRGEAGGGALWKTPLTRLKGGHSGNEKVGARVKMERDLLLSLAGGIYERGGVLHLL